jgi:predicted restriction endonuclease
MVKDRQYWLHKLAVLRIDLARGNPAPHKPLLLLVIMEMVEHGEIRGREVPLSPDFFRFYKPLADSWTTFDNSRDVHKMIAFEESGKIEILDPDLFDILLRCKEE